MSALVPDSGMSAAEFAAQQAHAMTEDQLQKAIIRMAERAGWFVYFTYISKGSAAGYPDLHLVHPGLKLSLFRELKRQNGRVSEKQRDWMNAMKAVGLDVDVWRPLDWHLGVIDQVLLPGMDHR